ncbi:MAG: M6 family metalloprotease domain-containing protein [Lentimicrobiaceae bacterium]|nr:M6 family metalloprotease domain-containing protein [Lentimicrobiaceae bacterium]
MKKLTFFLLVLLLIMASALYAVPADPNPVTLTQPNGETLTVRIKGDERINWYESMDGYTLLFNQSGFLSYAQLDEDGNLHPSGFIATNIEERDNEVRSFLNTIGQHLFYSDIQTRVMLKIWEIEDDFSSKGESRVTGDYKTICAFVQFPGKPMTLPMSQFENLMNQLGYTGNGTGSVRDFFKEASYNQFDLTITLCGVYTAPQSQSYYAGSDGTQRCNELARWLALQVAAEPHIDFSEYDSDNNGIVDGFHFIFSGMGQEAGGGYGSIWSHKWQFSPPVTQNGKSISVYSCSPELRGGSAITTIGVICHEMTHAFGAADYYDTDYGTGGNYSGTGNWDLMAEGSWNGSPGGNRPAHPNMYVKVQFGWVNPIVLNAPLTMENMPNSAENPVAYRINTNTTNEHFLLENRQQLKFDASVPGNGLLIYRVHSNVGSYCINCTHPQRMYPVCASSSVAMPTSSPSSYGSINSGGCPFPGSSNQTSFTDDTAPSMKSWANVNTNKPITNITHSNRLIGFDFMGGGSTIHYLITFDANSGEGNIVPQLFLPGEAQQLSANTFTKTGYNFVSWNTAPDGTGTSYTNQQSITVSNNTTLYAQWGANAYTLTLNPNGGTVTPTSKQVVYDAPIGELPTPERTGYNFLNWRIGATPITEETIWNYAQNMTTQAAWQVMTYTISATATFGGAISPSGDVAVNHGANRAFTITPDEDYEIVDVLVDGESIGIVSMHAFTNVTEPHTIHAAFKEIVGIVETHNYASLQIVPNPANHTIELRIRNYKLGINTIEFYNIFGQLIKSVPFAEQSSKDGVVTQRINISDFCAGVYMVRAGSKTVKLVVM